MTQRFLLCFHDYTIWNYKTVTPLLYEIQDLVQSPFSVLVVPYFKNASEQQVVDFRHTLLNLHNQGFELALHGFKHKANMRYNRSYKGLFQLKATNFEAEFAGLSSKCSKMLLEKSITAWNDLINGGNSLGKRIYPAAFVPPTWYCNSSLPIQVHHKQILFEHRLFLKPPIGSGIFSPVVSFAGIPKQMESIAFLFGKLMIKQPLGLPRIALHPTDFPRLKKPIFNLIENASKNYTLSFYRDV